MVTNNPRLFTVIKPSNLNRRIGSPLNINSRSEHGVILGPIANANRLYSEKNIFTLGDSARGSSVRKQIQTKKLPRWKSRYRRRKNQDKNDSLLKEMEKLSCCDNKTSKANTRNPKFKPSSYIQQGTGQLLSNKASPNLLLKNTKMELLQPHYPYIKGRCVFFFSFFALRITYHIIIEYQKTFGHFRYN